MQALPWKQKQHQQQLGRPRKSKSIIQKASGDEVKSRISLYSRIFIPMQQKSQQRLGHAIKSSERMGKLCKSGASWWTHEKNEKRGQSGRVEGDGETIWGGIKIEEQRRWGKEGDGGGWKERDREGESIERYDREKETKADLCEENSTYFSMIHTIRACETSNISWRHFWTCDEQPFRFYGETKKRHKLW